MAKQRNNRIFVGAIAGMFSAAVVAAVGGATWWTLQSQYPNDTPPPIMEPSLPAPKTQVYWLKDTGNKLELVPSSIVAKSDQPNAVLEEAFNSLLAGAKDKSVSSTIPLGTKLRSVKIKNNGIHVDLSEEFTSGGGSASMTGRLAQVLYTATTLDPNAKVWIDVQGEQLDVLGGEGLELEQPLTRKSFEADFTL